MATDEVGKSGVVQALDEVNAGAPTEQQEPAFDAASKERIERARQSGEYGGLSLSEAIEAIKL